MDLLKLELHCEVYSIQLNVKKNADMLAAGRWFSPDTLASYTDKTDHDDIAEILLKVALKTINTTHTKMYNQGGCQL